MKNLIYIIIFLGFFSCKEEVKSVDSSIEAIAESIKVNDEQLEEPESGDWLYEHEEPGQTFNQYLNSSPISTTRKRNVIYLQPIGEFDSIQTANIKHTAEYLNIFFGLKTVILENIDDKIVPDDARREGMMENEQLLATHILYKILKKRLPKDAIGMMAITEKDLYPRPSWNFVFGLSSLKNRVSVTSVFRFRDDFDNAMCLSRLIKVSSHEISHMLSMKHCINAVCVMNGSNHLLETDEKPNRLCSECLQKLTWNLNLKTLSRMEVLSDFFKRHELINDYEKVQKDIEAWKQTENKE